MIYALLFFNLVSECSVLPYATTSHVQSFKSITTIVPSSYSKDLDIRDLCMLPLHAPTSALSSQNTHTLAQNGVKKLKIILHFRLIYQSRVASRQRRALEINLDSNIA